jgi:hypothetical protein
MLEQFRPQGEYDAGADRGGEIGLRQPERTAEEPENARQEGEPDDECGVALEDAIILMIWR